MKIAILADLHWGCRSDSNLFLDYMDRFYTNIFFPYIEENKIETVILAGDIVDRRKYININTAKRMREHFLDKLRGKTVYAIAGNHDVYHKNTNEINALTELMSQYDFKLFIEPDEITIDDTQFLMLPWICHSNYERSMKLVNDTKAQICIAHLELQGFEMFLGSVCNNGMDPGIFNKFDLVFTGHFHRKSSKGNIHYLGSPYQMIWSDYDDMRGFHIFDTQTRELEFIQNPYLMFHKIVYDDEKYTTLEEVMNWEFDFFKDTYVKLIVRNKTNPYWFDLFVDQFDKISYDLKIIEDFRDQELTEDLTSISNADDTQTILKKVIDNSKISGDKEKLKHFLINLYNEALITSEA